MRVCAGVWRKACVIVVVARVCASVYVCVLMFAAARRERCRGVLLVTERPQTAANSLRADLTFCAQIPVAKILCITWSQRLLFLGLDVSGMHGRVCKSIEKGMCRIVCRYRLGIHLLCRGGDGMEPPPPPWLPFWDEFSGGVGGSAGQLLGSPGGTGGLVGTPTYIHTYIKMILKKR